MQQSLVASLRRAWPVCHRVAGVVRSDAVRRASGEVPSVGGSDRVSRQDDDQSWLLLRNAPPAEPRAKEWVPKTMPEIQQSAEAELDAVEALLVLRSMVEAQSFDRKLMGKIADSIECRYHSMQLGTPSEAERLEAEHLGGEGDLPSYRSIVDGLPLHLKVKLVLLDDVARETGRAAKRKPAPEPDPKAAWRTVDPVEMEEWEKRQFELGRLRIKRMRNVEAKVTRMQPGKRLRALLSAQLMAALPAAELPDLAVLAQICAFRHVRYLHGDVRDDFEEALARRVCALSADEVKPYILAFASSMKDFGGPVAYRAWRTVLLPVVKRLGAAELPEELLLQQVGFHPRLRGCKDVAVPPANPAAAVIRAAELYIAVLTARQVEADASRYDSVARPLKALLGKRLAEAAGSISLETLGDLFSALTSSGVKDAKLARMLLGVFARFQDAEALSSCRIADLATFAHGAAVALPEEAADAMDLIWQAAEPQLRESEPHLVLMLLDALVRAGTEELITSKPVLQIVDEVLVQRFDFQPEVLGRLG